MTPFAPGDRVKVVRLPAMPGRHKVKVGDTGIVIGKADDFYLEQRLTIRIEGRFYCRVQVDCLALVEKAQEAT